MEFDKTRVYTALNADELKVGSKVVLADSMKDLREKVEFAERCTVSLSDVDPENYLRRFVSGGENFGLCYLISELEENKLKWTDLKLGDVIRQKEGTICLLVTGIDVEPSTNAHIFARDIWVIDSELENWEKVEE